MYDIIIGRDEEEKKKYGKRGTILIGRQYVYMGQTVSLSNDIYLDIARAHVMFVCGKRGGGKCLSGNTIITLADGSQVTIKDLESNQQELFALNDQLKIQTANKSHFYKRQVNKILQLTLRTGKTIELTPEHPLLTVDGWTPAQTLNIGSRIATPRKVEAFGNSDLTESQVKILAYLFAEGHLGNGFVLFCNADEKIVNDFKLSIQNFDSNLQVKQHGKFNYRVVENKPRRIKSMSDRNSKGQFTKQPEYESRKSSLRVWLDDLKVYGKLSYQKELIQQIHTLSKQKTAVFLNRLFSCDGSIHKKDKTFWCVTYSSSSKKLAEGIAHLLLKFGIVARVRQKKTQRRDTYELSLYADNLQIFLQEIGFYGEKEKRASVAIKEHILIKRNPNVDTIPKEIWDNYTPQNWSKVGHALGYKHPKAARESIYYSTSRQKMLTIAQHEQSDYLLKFATSDIFWDEVVGIQEIEGEQTVYDITVPELHNFVANDIIVHNSYTLGAIAEGLAEIEPDIAQNISIIILDTMGIYWTMKFPNTKDEELLKQWKLEPKGLDVKIYTPIGFFDEYKEKGIPTDYPFSIKPSELTASDWCMAFEVSPNDAVGVLIQRVIYDLKESDKADDFTLDDIFKGLHANKAEVVTKDAALNLFNTAKHWGLFSDKGTPLTQLAQGGQVTILDISCYTTSQSGWAVKQLAVGIIAQKLFVNRMIARKDEEYADVHATVNYFGEEDVKKKRSDPLVWLVIDEAHEFLPRDTTVASSGPLITILREGRQPGISLILATQQPGKIHTDVLTQSDTVFAHRITAKLDTDALSTLTQSYMRSGITEQLDTLPRVKGAGVIFDDTNEKLFVMRIRPRFTWHGGSSPNAIPNTKKFF